MPRINELADDYADRFAVEPSRMKGIARYLREAGLISQGARGVNAASATPLDGARMLFAAMLLWRPASRAALDVDEMSGWTATSTGKLREQMKFDRLDEAVSKILAFYGEGDGSDPVEPEVPFVASISIAPHVGYAEIEVRKWEKKKSKYWSEAYVFMDGKVSAAIADDLKNGLPDRHTTPQGFSLRPIIYHRDIIAIGQVIAGKRPLGWSLK